MAIKKTILTLSVFALLFTSCSGRSVERITTSDISTSLDGVLIDGVRWATRNVDALGTFAENPEDFGMLFQWNRKKAWNTIDRRVEGWNSTNATGTAWYTEAYPCPKGWRLPTNDELLSLRNAGVHATLNGVNGRLFGTYPYQIFLPAAGWRDTNGTLKSQGTSSLFWRSTPYGALNLWGVWLFSHSGLRTLRALRGDNQAGAFSVRCVAK